MNDEQRRMAASQAQPAGPSRARAWAVLSFAHVAGLRHAHEALPRHEHAAAAAPRIVGTGPSLLGQSAKRLEDPPLLRGEGRYIDDIHLSGQLEAAFVRSQFAHARINRVDSSEALALPGVRSILVLDDLLPWLRKSRMVVGLPSKSYRQLRDRPVLCDGETVYVGEPIAIVVADNRYLAEDAAERVRVDYDPLPAVSDCRAALASDAALVHQDAGDNLLAEFRLAYGDVESAFASAARVFEESLWIHRGGGHSIECRGVVADYDRKTDDLTLWNSTQMPHASLRLLVDMLGRDESQIRVVTPDIGGGFGPKLVIYQEEVVVSAVAIALGQPIKWIEDRREYFAASTQERDQYWDVAIAVDGTGKILGVRGRLIHDHGAYTARGINIPQNSAEAVPGSYRVPAYRMDIQVAMTNKVPVTPVRGAGHPQGVFVMERLLDRVARGLGVDRAEIRARNLIPPEQMPYKTQLRTRDGAPLVLDSGDYLAAQRRALNESRWETFPSRQRDARAEGRHLGIGMANFVKGTGSGPFEEVTVRIGTSGRVRVFSGAAAIGQGTATILAQVVAESLGRDLSNISVTTGDTRESTLGIGTSNSRVAVAAGLSAHQAAVGLRKKVLRVAAQLLSRPSSQLDIEGDQIVVAGPPGERPNRHLSLSDIANALAGTPGYPLPTGESPGLDATERVVLNERPYAHGSAVAEVEVDVDTGQVTVLNYTVAHDCGRRINPLLVEGQVLGATAHGLGNSLYEHMRFDESGQPLTMNLGEYLLITAPEMPAARVIHTETATDLNVLGVKGVGECATIPVPAAVISAVEDALLPFAVRISQAPIAPPELLALIEQAKAITGIDQCK